MKLLYKQKLETSYDTFNTSLMQLRVKYVQGLEKMMAGFQKAGELDDLLACRTELERFNEAQTVQPEHLKVAPAELARIQKAYVDFVAAKKAVYAKDVIDISKAYVNGLDKAVTEYTRANRLEDALLARKERGETASGKLVLWAAGETNDRFFLEGILEDPTPDQYGKVLEMLAKDFRVLSIGYGKNKDKRAPSAVLYRGGKKLFDNPSQGMNLFAMTPKGKSLGTQVFNQKNDREGERFARMVNDLDDGSVVVLVVDDYVRPEFRPKLEPSAGLIGCDRLEDVPKGGAYYCIGIKGLDAGEAIEDFNSDRAGYPDIATVTSFLDTINEVAAANAKPEPANKATAPAVPPSRFTPPRRKPGLSRPSRPSGFKNPRIGER